MLNPEDRRAIEGLFERLQNVEARSPERDEDAEALIQRNIAIAPAAPYYMAQTILVQEHALKVAEQRMADLERQLSDRPSGGGLFGGLFGDNRPAQVQRQPQPQRDPEVQPRGRGGPWDRDDGNGQGQGFGGGRGGGFLAGAAQTAMGVAGGVLLGNAIAGAFGAGAAQAGEVPQDEAGAETDPGADNGQDTGQDAGDAGGDAGGDFGDMGGGGDFDFGGDF